MRPGRRVGALAGGLWLGLAGLASAQTEGGDPNSATPFPLPPGNAVDAVLGRPGDPVGDQRIYVHGLLEELEGRLGSPSSFRWEGQGWVGTDYNRLWAMSEGEVTRGRVGDGQQELYYSRPVSTYFDAQLGGRYDLDSSAGRGWAAAGVEGYAPYDFTLGVHAYASDRGRYAAKLEASNEIRFTQRLVLEPQAEINLYTRRDRARGVGSGLSDIDAGLRLRYEITRKFAPYGGVTWERGFGQTADLARLQHDITDQVRLTFGVRSWF